MDNPKSKEKNTKGGTPPPAKRQSEEIGDVLKSFGYKLLFRFESNNTFVEIDIPFTPAEGTYLNYKETHYKVYKVLHDIDKQETKVLCKRTN